MGLLVINVNAGNAVLLTSKLRKRLIYTNDDDLLEKYTKVQNFLVKFENVGIFETTREISQMTDLQ